MKHLNIIGAGLLLSLLATAAPAHAADYGRWSQDQQDESTQWNHQGNGDKEDSWKQENKDERADEKSARKDAHLSRKEQNRLIRGPRSPLVLVGKPANAGCSRRTPCYAKLSHNASRRTPQTGPGP